MIKNILQQVSTERMRSDLFSLCRDPLPYRKVNYTRPGKTVDSLAEADSFICGQLQPAGYDVATTTYRVQAFRCNPEKPLHHWYDTPHPDDPFYDAANLETARLGSDHPEEIIQLISHKDSMSWIDSPGAHDNAAGTVANLELARVLATCPLRRTVRFLFCNEEHTPWTSRFAADEAMARGDRLIAIMNVDSLDGKSDEDISAGHLTHTIGYSTEEGKPLADFIAGCAARHELGLNLQVYFKEFVNDDDGMFIKAGYRTTVVHCGSWPYADAEYHLPGDVPERVNLENLRRSTQLLLAAVLEIDAAGVSAFLK